MGSGLWGCRFQGCDAADGGRRSASTQSLFIIVVQTCLYTFISCWCCTLRTFITGDVVGAEVGGSFLQQQLVDELHVYIGATLLGSTSKRWAQTALTSTIGGAALLHTLYISCIIAAHCCRLAPDCCSVLWLCPLHYSRPQIRPLTLFDSPLDCRCKILEIGKSPTTRR